ncbi:MAG: FRG domain-containing protein [Candidatus Ancaeobacter aquaticus]|nr:FRG domain-containing protein [Candidatus Ancaeobacter aquaticus]
MIQDKLFADKTGAEGYKIESVGDIIKLVVGKNKQRYFRGQANVSWEIRPSIGRNNFEIGGHKILTSLKKDQEEELLHRFRRHTYEHQGRILDKWEALFLARHHGLPVRLLDWTTNPLVALYWASIGGHNSDGVIWVFERRKRKLKDSIDVFDKKYKNPEDIKGIRIIHPFYPSKRMTAQAGIFTIHKNPAEDIAEISKTKHGNNNDILKGFKCLVPNSSKMEILRQLDRLNINERLLFPELDGIAKGLLYTELLFGCK